MTRRNIANILTCLRRVWAVYKRGILLLLLVLQHSVNPLFYCGIGRGRLNTAHIKRPMSLLIMDNNNSYVHNRQE